MPAILTVTFNPCIDINTTAPFLRPEIKLRCSSPLVQPGGGGINVARAIRKLGGHAVALFPCGGNSGQKLKSLLAAEGVSYVAVSIQGETRENFIVTDQSDMQQYRFTMPGPDLDAQACAGLLSAIERQPPPDYIVVSGSLPAAVDPSVFRDLSALAKRLGAKLVVDSSGVALRAAVDAGAYLIKLSVHELAFLAGKQDLSDPGEIEAAARRILAVGSRVVVVSMGGAGAIWVSDGPGGQIAAPAVKTVSTVGAGDSMVGGIVRSLARGRELATAIEYGVACGTAATLQPGTSLCNKQAVEAILAQMKETYSTNNVH